MKKLYTILLASVLVLNAAAQTAPTKMYLNLKNGFNMELELDEVESITFDVNGGEETPDPGIPSASGVYKIDVPDVSDFTESKVYKVLNESGNKIAEICYEYINAIYAQRLVVYPCYIDGVANLSNGIVVADGGSLVWNKASNTCTYTEGSAPVQTLYYDNGSLVLGSDAVAPGATTIVADVINDNRNPLDVKKYGIVKIGTQYWMAENLAAKTYLDGSSLDTYTETQIDAWKNTTKGAYHMFADDQDFETLYGLMYNAYAMIDSRGLAPAGWNIPELSDYSALKVYLGANSGNKMKSTVPMDWNESQPEYTPTDLSGFSANAAGVFLPLSQGDGGSNFLGTRTYFWTKTTGVDSTFGAPGYMYVGLTYSTKALFLSPEPRAANFGQYIRCIRK